MPSWVGPASELQPSTVLGYQLGTSTIFPCLHISGTAVTFSQKLSMLYSSGSKMRQAYNVHTTAYVFLDSESPAFSFLETSQMSLGASLPDSSKKLGNITGL